MGGKKSEGAPLPGEALRSFRSGWGGGSNKKEWNKGAMKIKKRFKGGWGEGHWSNDCKNPRDRPGKGGGAGLEISDVEERGLRKKRKGIKGVRNRGGN